MERPEIETTAGRPTQTLTGHERRVGDGDRRPPRPLGPADDQLEPPRHPRRLDVIA